VDAGVEEHEELEEADMGLDSSDCGSLGFFRPCLIATNVSNPRAALTINCRDTHILAASQIGKNPKVNPFTLDLLSDFLS